MPSPLIRLIKLRAGRVIERRQQLGWMWATDVELGQCLNYFVLYSFSVVLIMQYLFKIRF